MINADAALVLVDLAPLELVITEKSVLYRVGSGLSVSNFCSPAHPLQTRRRSCPPSQRAGRVLLPNENLKKFYWKPHWKSEQGDGTKTQREGGLIPSCSCEQEETPKQIFFQMQLAI